MVDPNQVLQGRTRETKIRRDDAGRWFEAEDEITHPLLTQAFDSWLIPAPDDSRRWCLSNDINWAYVSLEGPPRFVRSIDLEPPVRLRLSDQRSVLFEPGTLRRGLDEALYCDVPCGETSIVARFDRHAAMQLSALLDEDDEGVFLRIGDLTVRPPRVSSPLKTQSLQHASGGS